MLIFKLFSMKKHVLIAMAICVLALASTVYALDADSTTIQGLNVTTDVDAAFNTSHAENKTLVIIFDSESCVYCDIFKKDVLGDSKVQEELNGNFTVLLVDANKNPNLVGKYKVYGTPEIQFVAPDGKAIGKIDGSIGADDFLKALKEI